MNSFTFIVIFSYYIAGLFVVGLPIGLGSLWVWKGGSKVTTRKVLGFILFPTHANADSSLGHSFDDRDVFVPLMKLTMSNRSVLLWENKLAQRRRMKYVLATMLLWPLRLASLLLARALITLDILFLYSCLVFILATRAVWRGLR